MKKLRLLVVLLFALSVAYGQIINPIKWKFDQRILSDTEAELIFTAQIDSGWHLYGMEQPEEGPIPTKFKFSSFHNAKLDGKITPTSTLVSKLDETFGLVLNWYEKKGEFVQKIKITNKDDFSVTGYVEFMGCNDENCLPPSKSKFSLGLTPPISVADSASASQIKTLQTTDSLTTKVKGLHTDDWSPIIENLKKLKDVDDNGRSLWYIFISGFLGGLLALFTPCVWPIIPMTVSFFLKRNKDKKKGQKESIFYGLSIVAIYVSLGLLITLIFGASALNTLSTNSIFNVVFFGLLVVFAISFFGYFEITLPSSWSTKLNEKAEHSTGIVSILLMAFTLVVVSFSCTGPIIGTLLVEVASDGSLLAPAVGMFSFALALSIPFTLFALFPSWLNAMPRSGGWMNNVKVFLAFFELGLALKFLSVADMVSDWGILSRNLFIAIWLVLALGLGLYMLGLIRFPHDGKNQRVNWVRRFIAVLSFLFVAWISCGFFGAPLRELSAFLPPAKSEKMIFHDYDEGMAYARKHNKPVMVDFTGYGCVNCRKMESSMFTKPEIEDYISQFVLISLYVDERKELPEPLEVIENGQVLILETYGDKWSYLQRFKFGSNAQPQYFLLDNTALPLVEDFAYETDAKIFADYFKVALKQYSKIN